MGLVLGSKLSLSQVRALAMESGSLPAQHWEPRTMSSVMKRLAVPAAVIEP